MRNLIGMIILLIPISLALAQPDRTSLEQQIAEAADSGQEERQLDLLLQLAQDLQRNDPRRSYAHAMQALELAEEIGHDSARAQALSYLGIAHYYLGEYQQALRRYQECLAAAEKVDDLEKVANALNNIGILYFVWGDHGRALDYYFRALRIRQDLNDSEGTAKAYNNLANVHHSAGQFEEAQSFYEQALEIYEQLGDRLLVAGALNNIGLLNYDTGRYEESLQYYERALAMERETRDKPGMALSLNNMGMVLEAWQRFSEALARYQDALAIREEIGDRQGVSVCLHNMGTVHTSLGDFSQAIRYLEEALSIARELNVQEIIRDNNLSLSEVYQQVSDHEQALLYYQQYKAAHDVIFDEERSRQMAAARARYETDLKDSEIVMLRKDKEIEQIRRNVLLVGTALFLLIILLLFNRYRFQKRAHREIQQKNEALQTAHAELEQAAQAELTHVARVATMGELAAAFAHELNQPLTAILTNARAGHNLLGVESVDKDEVDEALEDIVLSADRAQEIIKRLRELMRKGEIQRKSLDINRTLRGVETFAQAEARHQRVQLDLELEPNLPPVKGDKIQLQQVLLNLVQNGAAAMAGQDTERRRLLIRTSCPDAQTVEVAVCDAGPELDEGVLTDMFEPFFTTKSDGLGMGLPICRTIIEAHGGRLWADPNPQGGLTVRFTLPVVRTDVVT